MELVKTQVLRKWEIDGGTPNLFQGELG